MRPPPPHVRRRRRGCRCPDKYLLMAGGAFLMLLLILNTLSKVAEQRIRDSFDERLRQQSTTAGGQSPAAKAVLQWSPSSVNPVELARDLSTFIKESLAAVTTLLASNSPSPWFLFLDVELIMGTTQAVETADAAEAFVGEVLQQSLSRPSLSEALEALDSVQAVLRIRGYKHPPDVCEQQRRKLLRERSDEVVALTADAAAPYPQVWAVLRSARAQVTAAAMEASTLLPERLAYVLDSWISSSGATADTASTALREAYARAVDELIRTRVRTVRTAAANYTFIADGVGGAAVVQPGMCMWPAVLARGVRFGAHLPIAESGLSGTQVLQAAEALAVTCLRFYADAELQHFTRPLQAVPAALNGATGRAPFRPVVETNVAGGAPPRCDVPLMLLRSFYELYLFTQDRVYVSWAMYVMSVDAMRCPVAVSTESQVGVDALYRYAAELRYLALLSTALNCDLYRGKIGLRGACDFGSSALTSQMHHLVLLPSDRS